MALECFIGLGGRSRAISSSFLSDWSGRVVRRADRRRRLQRAPAAWHQPTLVIAVRQPLPGWLNGNRQQQHRLHTSAVDDVALDVEELRGGFVTLNWRRLNRLVFLKIETLCGFCVAIQALELTRYSAALINMKALLNYPCILKHCLCAASRNNDNFLIFAHRICNNLSLLGSFLKMKVEAFEHLQYTLAC